MDIRVIKRAIQQCYKREKNWRKVAEIFGISSGMAWRIVKQNYEPKEKSVRNTLGLPPFTTVVACNYCGGVHLKKSCPQKHRHIKKSLFDFTEKELIYMLQNREDYK